MLADKKYEKCRFINITGMATEIIKQELSRIKLRQPVIILV